jgi:pectate lyase
VFNPHWTSGHMPSSRTASPKLITAMAVVALGAAAILAAVLQHVADSPTAQADDGTADALAAVAPSAGFAASPSPSVSASPSPSASPSRTSGPATPAAGPVALAGWPTPTGQEGVNKTRVISGDVDGGMKRFHGFGGLGGGGQDEDQDPLFTLANGATLRNVIIGAPAADGVHCAGACTLINVWWEDVGEDAATFRGTSASQTMTVDGGGARGAADKVFQHNGPGTMVIRNFQVSDFGMLYRSCGNCSTQYARHVVVSNVRVDAPGGRALVGINPNYGDTATLRAVTIVRDPTIAVCERYQGVTSGEPVRTGSGADGRHCRYTASDISYR